MPIRILLIDDHPMLRSSIRDFLHRQLPGVEVVGEAGDCDEAWRETVRLAPDLIVMDLELPGIGGIELTRRIHQEYPKVVVLVLTAHAGAERINTALEAGASGYMLKSSTGQELANGVKATLAGETFLSPAVSTIIVREYQRRLSGVDGRILSAREVDTLKRIAEGHTTKEIAFDLRVSIKTVETHRLNVMGKLGINTVAGLTKFAVREGLTSL
jgi:DNA-binding NarL/FixJ family response regulator